MRASDLGSFENQARGLILSLSCVNLLRSFVSITNLMAKLNRSLTFVADSTNSRYVLQSRS